MGYYTIQKGFVFRQRFPYEYTACYIVELLIVELFLLFVLFWFHNRNVLKLMIELISAAKVGKISETDVSLPEKVVSNQEKCQVPWQIGTCPVAALKG